MNSSDLNQLSINKNLQRENWSVQIIIILLNYKWTFSMSTGQNADITRKLIFANKHSAAKCNLTLNDDVNHIKGTKYHRSKTSMTWLSPATLQNTFCMWNQMHKISRYAEMFNMIAEERQFTEIFFIWGISQIRKTRVNQRK